jgi:hypothetical protein
MSNKPFKIEPHNRLDKFFNITGPDGFTMRVDQDDFPVKLANHNARKVVAILNENWEGLDCDSCGTLFIAGTRS